MKVKDLKYFLSYILPAVFIASIFFDIFPYVTTTLVAFVLLPILEQFLPQDYSNVKPEQEEERDLFVFDALLYLNILLVGYVLYLTFSTILTTSPTLLQQIGLCLSLGTILATHGINVAHELGHREGIFPRIGAGLLLLPSFDLHFTLEHNYGHHVYVATPDDPTSARKGESIFAFWVRAIIGSFRNAWKLENRRIKRNSSSIFSHTIAWFCLIYIIYASLCITALGITAWVPIIAGILSMVLLQSINYIEHYGIQRQQNKNGKYEPVKPWHSWNSNHTLGRIVLYELTRHSDHHYKANRKYQNLRTMPQAPQLPLGYPGSILLALIPPLWFKTIDAIYADYLANIDQT